MTVRETSSISTTCSSGSSARLGDLLRRRLAAELDGQLALDRGDLALALGDVDGQADGAALVGDAALDRLADPQRRVGGEAEALAVVELLDGADQAEHALLDEVEQAQLGLRPWYLRAIETTSSQVVRRQPLLGGEVARLDAAWRARAPRRA